MSKRSFQRLFKGKAKKAAQSRYDKIVSDYGKVLEKFAYMVNGRPKSRLPCGIPEIKEAIIKVALANLDEPEYLQALKAAFVELATFVNDETAMFCEKAQAAFKKDMKNRVITDNFAMLDGYAKAQKTILEEMEIYRAVFDEVFAKLKVKVN